MKEHYHFIGIGGIGMSGLARILLSRGIQVSGSDIAHSSTVEELIRNGAEVHLGHKAEHIHPHYKIVFNADIKRDNPEYNAAMAFNCQLMHRADLLAQLLQGHDSIAVAGTHGKTTTSSLLTTVLTDAGLDPSFAIGGILPSLGTNAVQGKGNFFIFEADESDRSFLKYSPTGAIVTNVDHDHLSNYEGNYDLLIDTFKTFMSQVQSKELLFWCGDDPGLCRINHPGHRYGFNPGSDWRITRSHQEGFYINFDLEHGEHHYTSIQAPLAGRHNILNAAAIFAFSITLGISEQTVKSSLQHFKGVLRRCERKGVKGNRVFLDDYAHHPTEIKTTLEGIRKAIGSQRLIAVFQPHRYTRTRDCLGTYGTIFDQADELLITDIFAAGEAPIPSLSHQQIVDELKEKSDVRCRYVPRTELGNFLVDFSQPGDVIATLGAGDITKLSAEVIGLISE
jgi:UDP-N-acetylmuramate--alanine ligase